jgi:PKD repeat protein
MKRIIYLLMFLPFILFSCQKVPEASFSTDTPDTEVGQTVLFDNHSHYSDRFEWDFGDGTTSTESNPAHIFTATNAFKVTLTAFSKGSSSDKSNLTINVMAPTLLEVEVREWTADGNGNVVPNASILLYPTLADWDAQTNSIVEAFTDADGVAVFSNLDPFVYYLDVWEQTHDNYTLRNEDVGWIRTPEVLAHKITGFIAYVDVVNHSSAKGNRPTMIVKKLGRKAIDKNQIPGFSGSWQDLLKRKTSK